MTNCVIALSKFKKQVQKVSAGSLHTGHSGSAATVVDVAARVALVHFGTDGRKMKRQAAAVICIAVGAGLAEVGIDAVVVNKEGIDWVFEQDFDWGKDCI